MGDTLFILGRTPGLAFVELQTFFPDISYITPEIARTATPLPLPASAIITKLGGTVKIAEIVGHEATISTQTLAPYLKDPDSFGVSMYGAEKISRHILEDLKKLFKGSRFIEAREGSSLRTVVVEKEKVQELVVIKDAKGFVIGKTMAVQPFEEWNMRDFGRPHADPAAGMLPPKVSRMIVNIADRGRDLGDVRNQKTLLDPFCGMGTVLAEALVMGWNVVGSDISNEVVEKARGNLRWLTEKQLAAEGVTYRLQVTDAVHVSDALDGALVDAIATEPYMGDTTVKPDQVKNTIKGLEKLYIGCLRDWHKVLKDKGVVVMALPMYLLNGKTYFVKKVIDMCENLGYTIEAGPIEYGRPQAVVKRVFYVFQKK